MEAVTDFIFLGSKITVERNSRQEMKSSIFKRRDITLLTKVCIVSSCLWNLGFFSDRCTEKLPLRVDFIHRVEFGEVSGHRVLIKRGPGNRGASPRGSTHEATSGMSSISNSCLIFLDRKFNWV